MSLHAVVSGDVEQAAAYGLVDVTKVFVDRGLLVKLVQRDIGVSRDRPRVSDRHGLPIAWEGPRAPLHPFGRLSKVWRAASVLRVKAGLECELCDRSAGMALSRLF
ncbi:hypothetical protein ACFPH6_30070 [Streptomyces xiangluensis]|uniref:Uncharacterized protein n=1 Tax=Streptomyces xiangluensis TaxID=2665720 RepID=A0ABV8YXB4_9ACTN